MATSKLKVTLKGSLAGQLRNIQASARGLGLKRVRDSRVVDDTPENRGMIHTARHLLEVEQA
ncbi:MAG: 50S ribosomal protein L30 [Gammaproteobacteria bacterium SG8_30]|jgi:large subunit ribosomal protein L30|nr:MAG: 50S ribosomal protein L30 [Gammaproteobacteria bacterium SG8_30]